MPNFSRSVKTMLFEGGLIPASSTMAARGASAGVYFHWKGEWMFTVVRGFYIKASDDKDFSIETHTKGKEIHKFK